MLGVAYNRSLLPDCHTSRTSSRTAKVPTAIGFVRPVRLVRLIKKNRARRSAARVYALTAYILALNKIIGENDVINAETLPKVKMPNRDGFISKYPDKY